MTSEMSMAKQIDNNLVYACCAYDLKKAKELINQGAKWPLSEFPKFTCGREKSREIVNFLIENKCLTITEEYKNSDNYNYFLH